MTERQKSPPMPPDFSAVTIFYDDQTDLHGISPTGAPPPIAMSPRAVSIPLDDQRHDHALSLLAFSTARDAQMFFDGVEFASPGNEMQWTHEVEADGLFFVLVVYRDAAPEEVDLQDHRY